MTDKTLMPFGKHKGRKLGDVPAGYLLWFYEQDWAKDWPDLMTYVAANYARLEVERSIERRERYYERR